MSGARPADSFDELTDLIYECALLPELWPEALDRLAELAGSRGGLLLTVNGRVTNWTSSDVSRDRMASFADTDLWLRSSRFARLMRSNHAGFVRDSDHYTLEEMADDPLYRDFLWPNGMGWCAATALRVSTGDAVVLSLERQRERGPVEADAIARLDALRPHIARSALLSARLQLERARVASETLELLGLAAVVLDSDGRAVAANAAAQNLKGCLRWQAGDRVSLESAAADTLLKAALAAPASATAVRSFVIRPTRSPPGMVAHLVPIRGTARDLFVRCAAILVLTPVTMPHGPQIELVQSLFDLSPAEARVARSLATGETVAEIAARNMVSPNTVRTQVRGILDKTGCRRQVEIVALLSRTALPPG